MTPLYPAKFISVAEKYAAFSSGRVSVQQLRDQYARGQARLAECIRTHLPSTVTPLMTPRMEGGHFRIDSLIDETMISRVYQGTDTNDGQPVAVKEPKVKEYQYMIEREWALLGLLNHPNIVRALAYQDGCLFEEYLPGTRLDNLCLSPLETLVVGSQILDALDRAHQQMIVLRDLKMENAIISPDGETKLFDFGYARYPSQKTEIGKSGNFFGTPEISAPEMISDGPALARPESDYYSLGILLYYTLTGQLPSPQKNKNQ